MSLQPDQSTPQPEDPRAHIPAGRRQALSEQRSIDDLVTGSALFADLSGFTALTERLAAEMGAQRGAEELAGILNRLFEGIIEDVSTFGGEVLYFSGDAITCWLAGDDGSLATGCAFRIQDTVSRLGQVETTSGSLVELGVKVSVAVGSARRFVVGNPEIQLFDTLAGTLIDQLASAEQVAKKGEVVLEQSALESLVGEVSIREARLDPSSGRTHGVIERVETVAVVAGQHTEMVALDDSVTRQWLLPTVYERLVSRGGTFLAELRTVHPMFVRFAGIDYDTDPDAAAKLDGFVRRAQEILDSYGGNVLQLTVGDKGAYLYATFGSPRAHEDDANRAVSAALELRRLDEDTAVNGLQIGIASGQVFSGTYGHPLRRTFACLGDAVNLAARLMSRAPEGDVLVSDLVVEAAGPFFDWKELGAISVKGKVAQVITHRLEGRRVLNVDPQQRYPLPMVGREQETAIIDAGLDDVVRGSRKVIGITGEPGLGKSRLVADVVRSMRSSGHQVRFGEAQAFGQNMSYLVWREIWQSRFDLIDLGLVDQPTPDRVAKIEATLERIDPALTRRAPLLSGLLGIHIPDNPTTASFDAKLRKSSLESLLADVLQDDLRTRPRILVLEDCQWIDDASLDLLEVLVRETEGLPLLILVAYRSSIESAHRDRLESLASFEELELDDLSADGLRQVALAKLEQQFGADVTPTPELLPLMIDRSEGNPFYVEELVNLLRRSEVDITDPAALSNLHLPESLQSLVLSRVDALDEEPRQTAKVASVVGREFTEPVLPGIYPDLGTSDLVSRLLAILGDADLIAENNEVDASWIFRHVLTRDVAYGSIPFALRATLHEATGRYLEQSAEAIELNLDLLAHHYWHSENRSKKLEYLRRAGEAAKAAYVNGAAIDYFERLAAIVERDGRSAVLRQLGEVLELTGDWKRAEEVGTEALELALAVGDAQSIGWSEAALAEISRKQGRFDEATGHLERAFDAFESSGDDAGRGRVLHLSGTVSAQHGDLEVAQRQYESSLAIRRKIGDQAGEASLLSNLGIVAEYSGDLGAARQFNEDSLSVRTALGDPWGIAVSKTNLGMIAVLQERYAEARELFDEAIRLNREVGDDWMVAVSHNNLGNANRGLGDMNAARTHYAASIDACSTYDDRWASAILLEDIAQLAALEHNASVACELLGAADQLREEIDTPRNDALQHDLDAKVALADGTSAHDEWQMQERVADRERGRALGFSDALDFAAAFCRP